MRVHASSTASRANDEGSKRNHVNCRLTSMPKIRGDVAHYCLTDQIPGDGCDHVLEIRDPALASWKRLRPH
jgi:hypothetical protein